MDETGVFSGGWYGLSYFAACTLMVKFAICLPFSALMALGIEEGERYLTKAYL